MPVQTKSYVRMSAHDAVQFQVWMEYEDTDFRVINDDGDPDDFRVIRWFGENYTDEPIGIELLRGGGQSWHSAVLPANSTFTQDSGGAVKYEFDVVWRYS